LPPYYNSLSLSINAYKNRIGGRRPFVKAEGALLRMLKKTPVLNSKLHVFVIYGKFMPTRTLKPVKFSSAGFGAGGETTSWIDRRMF